MNRIVIIGNATKDPETRVTPNGVTVCTFTVAVNNKYKPDDPAQFFRVSAWRKLGENCGKFLSKGSKVCVVGAVSLNTFTRQNGEQGASIEITADDVEFLNTRSEGHTERPHEQAPQMYQEPSQTSFTDVSASMEDDLPF